MFEGFSPELFKFFKELKQNNNREWFAENKLRYEEFVREPALEFIAAMQKPLQKVSPCFNAVPKKVGGSLMRIYRDIRFSKDKTPFKTNLGIHFRHQAGKDVHAPGFYFHADLENVFIGAGIWHPDNPTLNQIRFLIDDDQKRWQRTINQKKFKQNFELHGDSLKRPPKGYEATHPLIDDLKRKDHIGLASLDRKMLYSADLIGTLQTQFKTAMPYVRFLCDAIHLPS